MLTITDYITRKQWQEYCHETGKALPADWDGKFLRHPVTSITAFEAEEYCKHVGGRLLTETEWQDAFDNGLFDVCYLWEWTSTTNCVDLRVLRGGSWYADARYARVSYRSRFGPEYRDDDIGFRCAFENGELSCS